MSTRTIFTDEDNNQLECYVEEGRALFINVGAVDPPEIGNQKFIALGRNDVDKLIEVLTELKKEML